MGGGVCVRIALLKARSSETIAWKGKFGVKSVLDVEYFVNVGEGQIYFGDGIVSISTVNGLTMFHCFYFWLL